MGILEAIIGAILGSIATTAIAISDRRRSQRERLFVEAEAEKKRAAKDAEDAVNLARDLGHIRRDIAAYSQAFILIREDLEDNRKFLRKLVVRLAPDLLDDVL
jgi:uncharacterized membrane protein